MKNRKMVLKGSIPLLAIAILVTFVVVNAKSSSQDFDEVIIGEFCFNMAGYNDTWHFQVDSTGGKFYDIVGFDHAYPNSAFSGSAHRQGKWFSIMGIMMTPNYNSHGVYKITLDLSTGSGTVDVQFVNVEGSVFAYYDDHPFSSVTCPSTATELQGPTAQDGAIR